ncbi:MAG: dihydrodipicolinate synthase family protein [Actinobacteria bacterium]|nr:dihydrodipicolinate synthase family protein [Actinomycetota bacterium]
MAHFGRVVTAMATPFTQDGALDLDGVQRLATHLVDTGTDTVLVNGTTGESPTLSHDEVASVFAAVRDAVGDRAKVMLGTGTNDTAKSCAATAEAVDAGADAVLVVTPYYNRPSQGGLIRHFTQVAAAAGDVPVLLYDVPARTAREIELATLLELSQVPFLEPSPAPLKAILADLGLPAGPVRPPLGDASPATLDALRAALAVARGDRPPS